MASTCARCYYNKKLFAQAGITAPPRTLDEFIAVPEEISATPGNYGYCLRGGPGGVNGWMMFGATEHRQRRVLHARRHLDLHRSGLDPGLRRPGGPLQGRPGAQGQRQLGLQRYRRRLLFRGLRDDRQRSGRADCDRLAHEAGGVRHRTLDQGRRRQDPSRPSAMAAGRCSPTASTRIWPGS